MNIGWIFLGFAFLVILLMAFAPWLRKEQRAGSKTLSVQLNAVDTKVKRGEGVTKETSPILPNVTALNDDIRKCVLAGDKTQAINLYRERTGVALHEAKAVVDLLEQVMFHPAE